MAKKNDDFFVEKKPWSKVKDELLGCYLKPYVAKMILSRAEHRQFAFEHHRFAASAPQR